MTQTWHRQAQFTSHLILHGIKLWLRDTKVESTLTFDVTRPVNWHRISLLLVEHSSMTSSSSSGRRSLRSSLGCRFIRLKSCVRALVTHGCSDSFSCCTVHHVVLVKIMTWSFMRIILYFCSDCIVLTLILELLLVGIGICWTIKYRRRKGWYWRYIFQLRRVVDETLSDDRALGALSLALTLDLALDRRNLRLSFLRIVC